MSYLYIITNIYHIPVKKNIWFYVLINTQLCIKSNSIIVYKIDKHFEKRSLFQGI